MSDRAERLIRFKAGLWAAVDRYAVACGGSPSIFREHSVEDRYRLTIDVQSEPVSCWDERESVREWLHEIREALALHEGALPPQPRRTAAAVHEMLSRLRRAEAEVARLSGWMQAIEGGDMPLHDADLLQSMAYDAIMGKEAPE